MNMQTPIGKLEATERTVNVLRAGKRRELGRDILNKPDANILNVFCGMNQEVVVINHNIY